MLTVQYAVGSNETAYKELINHISLIKAGPHTHTQPKMWRKWNAPSSWHVDNRNALSQLSVWITTTITTTREATTITIASTTNYMCFTQVYTNDGTCMLRQDVFLSFKHFKCLKWMLKSYFIKVNKLSEWCQCFGENGSYITQTRAQNTSDEDGQKPNPNQSTRTYVTTRIDGVLNTRIHTERERNRDREKH